MDFFARTHTMFTAELSVLNLFLNTVHWGHASERVRRRWEKSYFLQVISCFPFLNFVGTKVSQERQSYKDMPRVRDSIGAASALLASVCVPSSIQCGLGRHLVWASFWCGTRTGSPGYCSWSVQACRLDSAATRASGVLGGIKSLMMISK